MPSKTRFLLNNQEIETSEPPGMLVLDYLRQQQKLMGTKEGCKEGDCGACTVLIGEMNG
ncbi:MAG: 2Fe-2S iron-sulfur cluster binding domain-containing protein, partial [Nitrosopumilaceae archaeon]|nr:2Fe-2S iron-sulfur cluster binding domain-containing protein [Nitrosopumilaceae archaeon]NIU89141.1 2Fe-2S iron-sulfur cluster binding domain-containing protein [Nitrosopumilaceae archaeon]NIV67233.1 2Fe-2S iron-sulfur cluster binding domain-containing protein [Nitrosopumilaceae archaeon]NIX63288.1 2Fe-2S iron-sulfur cluster binding domain-containing protein [Nitrosopumilaceae archaeon]